MNESEKSIAILKDWGFYADNLWHIDSVKGDFTDEKRMDILAEAINDPEVESLIISKIKSITTRSYE
jgi:hypothetical protein